MNSQSSSSDSSIQSSFARLWRLFLTLFEPHPSISDPNLRFNLPKLAAFLLYASAMSLLSFPLDMFGYGDGWLPFQPLIDAIVFGALYLKARSRNPKFVPEATILFNIAVIVISLVLAPDLSFLAVPMLLIPLLLCTMFLSYRLTLVAFALTVVLLVALAGSHMGVVLDHYILTSTAYVLVGFVVLIQTWYRRSYEAFQLRELEASELRYRSLLSEAFDGIIALNGQYIVTVESDLATMLGYQSAELVGVPISQILPKFGLQTVGTINEMAALSHAGETIYFDTVVVKDELFQDSDTLIAMRDVTESRKTKEALAHAQRVDSLGVLAGGIAHDFNNLLTGIKGQATIAQMKLPPDSPAQKSLLKLLASTERASDLTRQLLAYAGKGNFETKTFDFNEFADGLLKLLRSNLPTSIKMTTRLSPMALPVLADPGQLQQILLNLVINGAQAIDGSGEIVIATRHERLLDDGDPLPVMWDNSKLQHGDYMCCTVVDNGSGMNEATLARVFDPFFTTKSSGTGLGLAATLGALKAHSGNLQVYSVLGVGTEFAIWLPLAESDAAVIRPNHAVPESHAEKEARTVLIIDDEQAVRETTSELLVLAGYTVHTAENGRLGVELFEEKRDEIDIVLLDMQMPEMNGEATYYRLTAIDPSVNVVLMSGYSDLSTISRLTNDRNLAFMAKPFEHKDLLSTLAQQATLQHSVV